MDLNHLKTARKIASPCRHCGREFWLGKRNGRTRFFCSNACRQAYFRNAKSDRRFQIPDPLRNAENSPAKSIAGRGQNRGRGSILSPTDWPVDVLGGSRHSSRGQLDSELRAKIIKSEIGGRI
jgi:hypothetical protein